jgi:hypothetical protein
VKDRNSRSGRGPRAVPSGTAPRRDVGIVVAPRSRPPFEVNALALEDDTYHVLSASPEYREPTEHPIRLWTAVHEQEPSEPGSVIVQAGNPPRLLAVVHDLSEEPTWREAWVIAALDGVLREAERRTISHLGLEPLGGVYGKLRPDRFVSLLRDALASFRPQRLERVWLVPKAGTERAWERALRAGD